MVVSERGKYVERKGWGALRKLSLGRLYFVGESKTGGVKVKLKDNLIAARHAVDREQRG